MLLNGLLTVVVDETGTNGPSEKGEEDDGPERDDVHEVPCLSRDHIIVEVELNAEIRL
jgi:hypothetical protein